MFATFLNKADYHSLDLSTFINCSPERVLFYYYNSYINISLETYLQMKEWVQDDTSKSFLNQWLELIETQIELGNDLSILQDSEYLNSVGPYYHVPTNTRFFFNKLSVIDNEPVTSIDLGVLFNLHRVPPVDKGLEKAVKQRKNVKKNVRNKDELIKEIVLCMESLEHIARIGRHADYLGLFLAARKTIIEKEDLAPLAPEDITGKPQRPEEPIPVFNSILSLGISRNKQKEYQKSCQDYNHKLKVYYIRYREHEKACERYKNALLSWEQHAESFMERCLDELDDAENKLQKVNSHIEAYKSILSKSFIHPDYHQVKVLQKFKNYLETGRAEDLQDCMNLYEEEKHWVEIKASQERIENTIHFLQAESELNFLALEKTRQLIASSTELMTPGS